MRGMILLAMAAAAVGCQPPVVPEAPKVARVRAGTKVDLVLLDTISSGDPAGRRVPFLVRRNVVDAEGNVLVAAGTIAEGEIEASRAAGALSSLMNEPARLSVSLNRISASDGQELDFGLGEVASAGDAFEFTRDFTERYSPKRAKEAEARSDTAAVLRSLAAQIESGEQVTLNTPESRKMLESLAHVMDMPRTAEVLKEDRMDDVQKLLDTVRKGGVVEAATSGSTTLALDALYEIVNIAGEVQDRVKGIFSGRNIRAYAGTNLTGTILQDAQVVLSPELAGIGQE